MKFLQSTGLAVVSLSLLAATPSVAQANTRTACMEDIKTLCASEYRARDREKVRACLNANIDKASESCQKAVKAEMAATKNKQN